MIYKVKLLTVMLLWDYTSVSPSTNVDGCLASPGALLAKLQWLRIFYLILGQGIIKLIIFLNTNTKNVP